MKNTIYQTELHDLSEYVKGLRELFKMSQTRLSKLTGVSRSVIASIEQEKRFPNIETILKICDVIGITPTEFNSGAFHNWKILGNKMERELLHKSMRNAMDKTVLDAAFAEFKKEKSEHPS